MTAFDYSAAGAPVRDDLKQAHRFLWEHLRSPGNWWTGAQRVAIAAESRHASRCALCRERKTALSANAIQGEHQSLGALPPNVVEVVHRVRMDPARLSRRWFEGVMDSGLGPAEYVEVVGIVALLAGVDFFARALGMPAFPLPEPAAGEPSRSRPESARPGTAWVPMIAAEDAQGTEADLYGDAGFIPNIVRALSLVPDHVRALRRLSNAHYVPVGKLQDPSYRRALDRMQMELVAARVSALNECFY
jgi:alkylhydroperoxidase family enzyme